MPSLLTERIESVKAGVIAAASFAIAESTFGLIQGAIAISGEDNLNLIPSVWSIQWLLQLGIGAVSGFLFGVTYRYVIRDDRNSHLNDGAVLAFGLVRGLALIETEASIDQFWFMVMLVIQSIVCFAIARWFLDLAISLKLIKPFVNSKQ
ncbi:MAG: hypothetical protein Tsb0014_05760 [Pleurocapsa sp.]